MSLLQIPNDLSNDHVGSLDAASVFHSWSAQAGLQPLPLAGGAGSTVWDHDGNSYLDFSSQLVFTNLGHQHQKVVAAIVEQAQQMATVAPAYGNAKRAEAARLILDRAPAGFVKVFFTNGGAERQRERDPDGPPGDRPREGHLALPLLPRKHRCGDRRDWGLATDPERVRRGHVHVFGPYLYRSEFWAQTAEEESERALHHLERVIQAEGPSTVAAILLETIPGTGRRSSSRRQGYLAGVRTIADRYGIVLILDEVMAGFGRTGHWFALDAYDVRPDLITFAKGVNSGYVPVGGVVISDPIAAAFDDQVFPGGLTYSGHPLAAASIVAALTAMDDEGVLANAATIGAEVFGSRSGRVCREARAGGRGTRNGRVLGHRAGFRPGNQGTVVDAGDGSAETRSADPWPAAFRRGQPHPRRAAGDHHGGGGTAWTPPDRRRTDRARELIPLQRPTWIIGGCRQTCTGSRSVTPSRTGTRHRGRTPGRSSAPTAGSSGWTRHNTPTTSSRPTRPMRTARAGPICRTGRSPMQGATAPGSQRSRRRSIPTSLRSSTVSRPRRAPAGPSAC